MAERTADGLTGAEVDGALSPPAGWQAWQSDRIVAWSRLFLIAIALLMPAPLVRVLQLKLGPDPRLAAAAGDATTTRQELRRRGDLRDRRARLLAGTTVGYRLFVDPLMAEEPSTIAVDLAAVVGGNAATMDRKLEEARPGSRYVVVDHLLADWQVDAVRRASLRGVGLEKRFVRHYPHRELAAALVGMVGFEHTGLSGMELRLDDKMRSFPERTTWLRAHDTNPLWIEPDGYSPGRNGADVRLSIDLVVQAFLEQRLAEAVEAFNAGGGRAIIVDCRTGEILALCDLIREREGWDAPAADPARERNPALGRSRCATDPYEPGSTFKPFVWAAATEMGLVRLDEVLPTPESTGHRTTFGRLIRDSHYYGPSTWHTVLVKSMNSGMAIVAERMSHERMREVVARFGFGARTGCGLPGETRGIVTVARDWTNYSQTSVAMGHEISVTPLQMARAFCAFARDGTIPALRLTAVDDDDASYRFEKRVLTAEVARVTRATLRDVMLDGTGRRATSTIYQMFGKSGTAQLPKAEGGGYHEHRYVSSFVAGAPFDAPRVVALCVIDDPERAKGHWGGDVAGPVVRDAIDHALQYFGVPSDMPRADESAQLVHDAP